jgi:hypothetical protein
VGLRTNKNERGPTRHWVREQATRLGRLTAGVTLDADALIALERSDRRMIVLVARAHEAGARLTVPATVLAQALREHERHVRTVRLVRHPTPDVVPLDRVDATHVGRLLAASGTADIADAHVVICARRADQQIGISDADHLRRLEAGLGLVTI